MLLLSNLRNIYIYRFCSDDDQAGSKNAELELEFQEIFALTNEPLQN